MPFSRILLVLDGSEKAEVALENIDLVADKHSEIALCTISPDDDDERLARLSRTYLEFEANKLTKKGFKTSTTARCGEFAEALRDISNENKIDLIVAGCWIGSFVHKLPVLLRTPLLVVKQPPKSSHLTKVLVPLDGSFESEAVIPSVMRLSLNTSIEVLLLSVSPTPEVCSDYTAGTEGVYKEYCEVLFTEIRQQATAYLEGKKSDLTRQGTSANPMVVFGDPAEMIGKVALEAHADMIAMASHCRTGFNRLVHDSVSEKLLEHSQLPIMLVHAGMG